VQAPGVVHELNFVADGNWQEESIVSQNSPASEGFGAKNWFASSVGQIIEVDVTEKLIEQISANAGDDSFSVQIRGQNNISGDKGIGYGSIQSTSMTAKPLLRITLKAAPM